MDPIVTEVPGAPAPSVPSAEPNAPAKQPENPGDANKQPAPEPSQKPEDQSAAQRYAMMQERKSREQAEARVRELEAKLNEKAPEFNEQNDPDGTKQIEYLAEKKANSIIEAKLRELGLDKKIEEIRTSKAQDEFFEHVTKAASEFSHMGISVTKEEVKAALERFETKGITAQELVVLAKLPAFVSASKPTMPTPGDGTKPPTPSESPMTHEQKQNSILKRFGLDPNS